METGKRIGNVNVLDLSTATEESLSTIERIGNVNILITSSENASLVPRLNIGNVNCTLRVPPGTEPKIVMGTIRINREYFNELSEPISLVVMGNVLIDPDTPGDRFDELIAGIVVMGSVTCPEPLVGVVQSKVLQTMGSIRSYPAAARLFPKSLDLDAATLESFEDGADIAVVGLLRLTTDVPEDLLARKLGRVYALGHVLCREESAATLKAKLAESAKAFRVIPVGHALHEEPLVLDRPTLESLRDAKLYCTDTVTVAADVGAEALSGHLASLVSRGIVLCPTSLEGTFSSVCDLLENRVVFYRGELLVFDAEHTLRTSRLELLDGAATAFVTGELAIEPDVPAKLIAEKLDRIHNLGEIRCTPDQIGVVEARLGLHDGELVDSTAEVPAKDPTSMTNANIFKL